jgi:SAM-dependent methyltransferase
MTTASDYKPIADLYDAYVQTDLDVPFFLQEAAKTKGEILELTAGTGRVSIPLAEAGARLTCVDNSPEMLAILRQKLADHNLTADVVAMDIRELALNKRFAQIIIPFHAFAEISDPHDQRRTLVAIRDHLAEDGRFICTLHNPPVRLQSVTGQMQLFTENPLPGGGSLTFTAVQRYDSVSQVVDILEFFEEYGPDGVMQRKRKLRLRFRLMEQPIFESLIAEAGFQLEAVYGDYAYAPFDAATSPFMIWVLRR